MAQPVKLSDTLVLDARLCSEITERSIAGQIEFWASLGKAIEPMLRFDDALRLRKRGKAESLQEILESVGGLSGRRRLASVLKKRAFPHYEADAKEAGVLIRTEEGGRRIRGRFVNREFVPLK